MNEIPNFAELSEYYSIFIPNSKTFSPLTNYYDTAPCGRGLGRGGYEIDISPSPYPSHQGRGI